MLGSDRLTTRLRSASAWAVAVATSAAALSTCLARTKGPFLRCFVAARPLIRSDQINSHFAYAAKLTNHSSARLHPKHACTAALNLPMGVSLARHFAPPIRWFACTAPPASRRVHSYKILAKHRGGSGQQAVMLPVLPRSVSRAPQLRAERRAWFRLGSKVGVLA